MFTSMQLQPLDVYMTVFYLPVLCEEWQNYNKLETGKQAKHGVPGNNLDSTACKSVIKNRTFPPEKYPINR